MEKNIILIGEDHLSMFKEACKDDSLNFKVVTDLRSCLDAIREKSPHLLIVDYDSVGAGSVEICQTLKKYPGTQRIPQLFVAPRTATGNLLEVLFIPVDDYIFLPLDPEDFKTRVKVQIGLRTLKDEKKLASVQEKIEELEKLLEIFADYNAARQELAEIYEKIDRVEDSLKTLLKLAEQYYQQNNFGLATDVITRMKKMLQEKGGRISGEAQFSEALERCLHILGKK